MLKITIETDDGTKTIDLLPEEQKAFEHIANMPVDWIENAVRNRTRQAIDQIIKENSDRQPDKITDAERLTIVGDADIKSAKQKHEEFEAGISN